MISDKPYFSENTSMPAAVTPAAAPEVNVASARPRGSTPLTKSRRRSYEIFAGALAGAIGGIAGSVTMNLVQLAWPGESMHGRWQQGGPLTKAREWFSSTERLAYHTLRRALGRRPSHNERLAGGAVAHYIMGGGSGAIYGAAAAVAPKVVTAGKGMPFGLAVWAIADQAVLPLAGLSARPTKHGANAHAMDVCAHLVYGATTEYVRKTVVKRLTPAGSPS
jgi:putative membrane protein